MAISQPKPTFSPAQQLAYDQLLEYAKKTSLLGLVSDSGYGRTILLKQFAVERSAAFIRAADIFDNIRTFHPLQIQEAIVKTILGALQTFDTVVVDDYQQLEYLLNDCYQAARPNVLQTGLDAVMRVLEQGNKQLVLGLQNEWMEIPFRPHCLCVSISAFSSEDYTFFFQCFGGDQLKQLDYDEVHQFAPHLDLHQIRKACLFLQEEHASNTKEFLAFLESHALTNNVKKQEVEKIQLSDLIGVKDVIRQLEIDIITPLERKDLARDLGLLPKRGILLYGPPGTGKTSVGRALAHRLGNKFLLLDGTVISGTNQFYYKLENIIEKARQNAPSILFIDDCDLLFEDRQETGLYRYLLTVLDGLESKSNSQITVMLTAMNIGSLPPALIRSGRVELWLEMKIPDLAARITILEKRLAKGPFHLTEGELEEVATQMEGFTGADIKRVLADAANLYGYDLATEQAPSDHEAYMNKAIEQLRFHREQLASAPRFTAAHHPSGQGILE